ncbi:casein kinase I-like [Anopheles arabiensis]|uniref:casein kinase I-like n=1 Tax=Anopheles arabiensis TaxID=7173 RepID=UPI001AADF04C|nr:casein kinase I-like [Anopheles arabiensis]
MRVQTAQTVQDAEERKEFAELLLLIGELLDLCGGRFGLKTVSQLALQLLARPETFHELGYVHCDMKPDNVLLGRGTTRKTLHLIDFDLAEPYRHPRTGEHIAQDAFFPFAGMIEFAPVFAHLLYTQCLRL